MKRHGFTLVEMLVAMTLTLFIMVILSQAFITALDAFSQLKGIGDMEETLRVAATNLRSDLLQHHFEGERRLSDPGFLTTGPPLQGFFRIYQATPSGYEGGDLDTNDPATDPYNGSYGLEPMNFPGGVYSPIHVLHFTIRLRGNRRENFLGATVPLNSPLLPPNSNVIGQPIDSLYQGPTLYTSQWRGVAYFVTPR